MDIKITRRSLDNYQKTKREIPMLEMELREMENKETGLQDGTIMDRRDEYLDVDGIDRKKYECCRAVLAQKREELYAVREWIDAIEDAQARCVFKMFYIKGMKWSEIARKTGYGGNEDYPRRYIRDKYLTKCGVK